MYAFLICSTADSRRFSFSDSERLAIFATRAEIFSVFSDLSANNIAVFALSCRRKISIVIRLLRLEKVNTSRASCNLSALPSVMLLRVSLISCIRRSPNCPIPTKRAIRTANATANFNPTCLLSNRELLNEHCLDRVKLQPREAVNCCAAKEPESWVLPEHDSSEVQAARVMRLRQEVHLDNHTSVPAN